MEAPSYNRPLAVASWLFLCFAWGSTFLAIRFTVETIPPLLVGGIRHTLAGGVLFGVLALRKKAPIDWIKYRNAAIVGALTAGLSNGGVIVAEKTVPSAEVALSFSVMPLFLLFLNWVAFERVKPSFSDFVALPLGLWGTALVLGTGHTLEGNLLNRYEIALLVACPIFWSFGSLIGRRIPLPQSTLLSSSVQMIGGGLLLFSLAILNGDLIFFTTGHPTATSLWGLGYLTIVGSLLGFSAFAYAIKHLDSRLVSTYAFVKPVVALFLGVSFGERVLTVPILSGAFLTLLSVATVVTSRFRK